jgi:uncharacterized membrane protein YeaQ/YmgE (transglycosylase-associated protein family)
LTDVAAGLTGGSHVIFRHWWITLLFAVSYFTSMFLGTFCNVAFYQEIMQALNGNAVSIRRGFQFAAMRWRTVLLWSLFAGLVGYIIRAIEQRVGIFGKLIAGLIGFTWSMAVSALTADGSCRKTLMYPLQQLEEEYFRAQHDPEFPTRTFLLPAPFRRTPSPLYWPNG